MDKHIGRGLVLGASIGLALLLVIQPAVNSDLCGQMLHRLNVARAAGDAPTSPRAFVPIVNKGGASMPAPTPPPIPANGGRWSDPATWGGQVPGPNTEVIIPAGKTVVLDVSATVRSITVLGDLVWDDRDGLELKANWIMVHGPGSFRIGAEGQPFTKKATITLTGDDPNETVMGMGTKFLGAMTGGRVVMIGEPGRTAWTRLSATAAQGARTVRVVDATGWRAGDQIAIAPSDFSPFEAEVRTLTAVNGNILTLDRPLEHMHYGQIQTFGSFVLESRAEVALLSRNIVVRGEVSSSRPTFGGHTMFMRGSEVKISGVEFTRMGQRGLNGRYPVHFHLMRDTAAGSYLKHSAIHHVFQRFITVHTSNRLLIENNVCFDTSGHGVFIEDGNETGNMFRNNLIMLIRQMPLEDRLRDPSKSLDQCRNEVHSALCDTKQDVRSSGFWISHPDNHFVGNVVAGVEEGFGFWYTSGADGQLRDDETGAVVRFYELPPMREFRDNLAHSVSSIRYAPPLYNPAYAPVQTGSGLTVDFAQAGSAPIVNFTAYKNLNAGIWLNNALHVDQPVLGAVLADNRIGFWHDDVYSATTLKDSLIVGQSANQPDARSIYERIFAGNFFQGPSGVVFNKGQVHLQNVRFENLPNQAMAFTANTPLVVVDGGQQYDNTATGITVSNSPVPLRFVGNTHTFVLNDLDGSLSGVRGAVLIGPDLEFARTPACSDNAEWRATFCPHAVVYLEIVAPGSDAGRKFTFRRPDGATRDVPAAANGGRATLGVPLIAGPGNLSRMTSALSPGSIVRTRSNSTLVLDLELSFAHTTARLFYLDQAGRPDTSRPVANVGSAAEVRTSSGNAYFFLNGVLHLRLLGGQQVAVCANDTCSPSGG